MKRTASLLILLLSLIFASCLLESEKENSVTIPGTPDPANRAELLYNFNDKEVYYKMSDTVWLSKNDRINFRLVKGHAEGFEILVDDTSIWATTDTELPLFSEDLTNGIHKLQFKITVKSGTGSLADKMNKESVTYTQDYVLMVGEMPFKLVIPDIVQSNGTLKVSWNRYPHKDFQGYEIRKYSADYSINYSEYRSFFIKNQSQTTFEDSTYVGGKVMYRVRVDRGGEYITSNEQMAKIPYKHFLEVTRTSPGKVKLSWMRPPFYKNVKSYQVYQGYLSKVKEVLPSEFSVELDDISLFGQYETYRMVVVANVDDPGKVYSDRTFNKMDLTVGERVPSMEDLEYSSAADVYYVMAGSGVIIYNDYPRGLYKLDKDMNVIDSTKYDLNAISRRNLVISPNGKILYLLTRTSIVPVNLNDLSTLSEFIVNDQENGDAFGGDGNDFVVSNNNIILYSGYYPYGNLNLNILDFNTKTILFAVPDRGPSHLSANGEYFASVGELNKLDMYKYDGTTFQLQTTLPYTEIKYVRFFDNQPRLLIVTYSKVIVYDYLGNSEIASFDFSSPAGSPFDFDQGTQKYSIVVEDQLKILEVNNGSISIGEKTFGYGLFIKGKYIFANEGFASRQ